MRTRTCQRCGTEFKRTRRDPSIWCGPCRGATSQAELTALIFPDSSGIHSLHEHIRDAFDVMKANPESHLKLVKVIGHAGAVSQVERDDYEADAADRRYDDRQFESSQEQWR